MKSTVGVGPKRRSAERRGKKMMDEVLSAFRPMAIGRVTDSEKKPRRSRTMNPVMGSKASRRAEKSCGSIAFQSWAPREIRAKVTMMVT